MNEPSQKLHQQLYGIKAVEIDHGRDTAYAWYGGAEVIAIRCSDGRIVKRLTLASLGVLWTMDQERMLLEMKDALVGLCHQNGVGQQPVT